MAAAFSPENRIHKPLTSPLEDLHPHLSHLKTRWPVAAHKLAEFTTKSPKRADYSHGRHLSERGDDDLIILNVYG